MEADLKRALDTIEETFGNRLKREGDGAFLSVLPRNAEEVEFLAEVAGRHSIPLAALGAGTTPGAHPKPGSILVRFDLMRGVEARGGDEAWAEPGATWLELEEGLGPHGRGLAVYPTSAPRATVGGWLAEDGIGVGSYRYGRARENVLSADVVLAEGRRTVGGEGLGSILDAEGGEGIVVAATLRTRRAADDVPFALAFGSPGDLAEAAGDVYRTGAPLWHLALLNGTMARARDLGDDGLLFGAYPKEGAEASEGALREAAASRRGRVLPAAEAYRAWGQRFFPIAPSRPTPAPVERSFVSADEVSVALEGREAGAVQVTFARSGQALLLDLGSFDRDPAR